MATVTAIIDGTGSMGKHGFWPVFDKANLGLVKHADMCQLYPQSGDLASPRTKVGSKVTKCWWVTVTWEQVWDATDWLNCELPMNPGEFSACLGKTPLYHAKSLCKFQFFLSSCCKDRGTANIAVHSRHVTSSSNCYGFTGFIFF